MDTALQVRNRYLIRQAIDAAYARGRTASGIPPREVTTAFVEGCWATRGASAKEAWAGIGQAVARLMSLFKRAPHAWEAIKEGLGITSEGLPAVVKRITELISEGKHVLAQVLHKAASSFPLALFFVEHGKMPGLTALMARLVQEFPWLQKALSRVHGGAEVLDRWFTKYIPTLRRPVYAAIFAYVWLSVLEISWDLKDLIAGFTGSISLSELLSSLPESGIGALFAQFGLGTFAALPLTLILRLTWLTAQRYLEYRPGKGFLVRWDRLGVNERPEVVPT